MLTYTNFLKAKAEKEHDMLVNLVGGLSLQGDYHHSYAATIQRYCEVVYELNLYRRNKFSAASLYNEYLNKR